MEWKDVLEKKEIYLNLGGGHNCHPHPDYQNYIAVDLAVPSAGWTVCHDLREHIPLPDGSVTRIHTEDFIEHISEKEIGKLLAEAHRLLKPGGFMRMGMPDYNNPKDHPYLDREKDPRLPLHVTMTHYDLIKELVEKSPFERYKFYHFWDGNQFVQEDIDYSFGMIKRTPDNDPRSRRKGILQTIKIAFLDLGFRISRGFNVSRHEMQFRKGHPYYITSLVADLFKD